MSHYNYPLNTIIEIDEAPHKYLGLPMPGRIHLMHCQTGLPHLVEDKQGVMGLLTTEGYDELLLAGRLVVRETERASIARKIASETEWTFADCDELDPKARKMLAQCEVLDDHGVPNGVKAIGLALADHWTPELREKYGEHDNPHTIKRWRTDRGFAGDRNIRDMVRMTGRVRRAPYFDDVPQEVLQKGALLNWTQQFSYTDVAVEISNELRDINAGRSSLYPKPEKPYPVPHYATVRRACRALIGAVTREARDGKAASEADWKGSGRPLTAKRALELAIIDHTPINGFFVLDLDHEMVAGKPWLTVMIDVHSEVILGHVITYLPPSYWTVGEVLKRASLPKRPPPKLIERYPILRRICGKAAEIIVDNAAEFRSQALEDAAKGAGFAVRHCPIKKPRYRAIGERIFPTLQEKITKLIPGGSKPIALARKLGHDPEKEACVTVRELEALVNAAIAEYHISPHSGLQDRQPALMFEKSVAKHGIDLIHDLAGFQREIMDVVPGVQLSNTGLRLFNLRYHCIRGVPSLLEDLVAVEPRRQSHAEAVATVKVKYDPQDISVVHVWNRVKKTHITLRCSDETYADGMPLWFHNQLLERAREEAAAFNTEAERIAFRSRRIKAIRNISPEAKHRERITLARLYEIPRLRQITGNLVHLHMDEPESISLDEFIAHDLSATTMLDDEILAPRLPVDQSRKPKNKRDRRDAGQAHESQEGQMPARRTTRTRRVSGSYE